MLPGASNPRSKRLRESPSLHSNKPAATAMDQGQPSRKEKPAITSCSTSLYYPGTAIPRAGWFHACRLCRSWTAFAAESSNGTVPLCRRCAVKSAADVFPLQIDTNSAAAPEPRLPGPAPAAAMLQQVRSPVIQAPLFAHRPHPHHDVSSGSTCGLDGAAYQLFRTGNEGPKAHSSYHQQLLNAAASSNSNSNSTSFAGFAAAPVAALLVQQQHQQLQQQQQQLQHQQQQLQLQQQQQHQLQCFLASAPAASVQAPLAALAAGSGTLDAIASLLGRWRPATAAAPQQASVFHHLHNQAGDLGSQQLAQQVSADLLLLQQQLQQQHMPTTSHSQHQQQ